MFVEAAVFYIQSINPPKFLEIGKNNNYVNVHIFHLFPAGSDVSSPSLASNASNYLFNMLMFLILIMLLSEDVISTKALYLIFVSFPLRNQGVVRP